MVPLKTQAIEKALIGNWTEAIEINKLILQEEDLDDIDTLNRLAYAYLSNGDQKDAEKIYKKVLELDMKNPIAIRNLKRLLDGKFKKITTNINNLFIEETGKTKVIELLNVADKKILSSLRSGEFLTLTIKRNHIFAIDQDNQYIGMLPDDLGQRVIKFMDGGNEYEAYVRTVNSNKVSIFIRETKRAKKYKNQPSFISGEKSKISLSKKSLFKKDGDDDDE